MTPEWLSAYSDANVAIATWILVLLALKGLSAWRGHVVATEELERKLRARNLTIAMKDLTTDILALRLGRLPPSELEAGHGEIEGAIYKAKSPAYYLVLVDRGIQQVRRYSYEAMFLIPDAAGGKNTKVHDFLSAASTFRDAFNQYFFSGKAAAPAQLESWFPESLNAEKIGIIVRAPENGPDAYKARLMETLGAAIKKLESHLGSSSVGGPPS